MISIVDYGCGNLFSLASSLEFIGAKSKVCSQPEQIENAEKIILPGVGAFGDAAKKLNESGLGEAVKAAAQKGTPVLGICLGMQLLFSKSYEFGIYDGLDLIKGDILPLSDFVKPGTKIPHIGWNALDFAGKRSEIFKYINNGDFVYFVHSFFASNCESSVIATTEYTFNVTAAVQKGNVFGCQFHPEKSGETGLNILKAFSQL